MSSNNMDASCHTTLYRVKWPWLDISCSRDQDQTNVASVGVLGICGRVDGSCMVLKRPYIRSDDLWYNTLACWFTGTNDSLTKLLMFRVLFLFYNFLQNSLQKSFQFIFQFSYKSTKMKKRSFECPKSVQNYRENNDWNIRRLVDEPFVPANQQTSKLCCRL